MMMMSPSHLDDVMLLAAVKSLATDERAATASLVAHLAEVDRRQLHLAAGFSSLVAYCREVLLLPEDAACNRTTAVRMVREFPAVLPMLADGRLNLSTLRLLAPWLNDENHAVLLVEAAGKSKRDVEELIARRFPRSVTTSIRMAPSRAAAEHPSGLAPSAVSPAPRPARDEGPALSDGSGVPAASVDLNAPARRASRPVTPMSEDVFLIRLAAKRAMVERLRRAQDLLGHSVTRGDVTEVFDRALMALIEDLERKKFGGARPSRETRGGQAAPALGVPHSISRYIPVPVRRAVWNRDGGRCAYVSPDGRRCDAHRRLEFHHRRPFEVGGEATVENLELRCRAHNQYEADVFFAPFREATASRDAVRPRADGRSGPAQALSGGP